MPVVTPVLTRSAAILEAITRQVNSRRVHIDSSTDIVEVVIRLRLTAGHTYPEATVVTERHIERHA